MKRSIVIKCLQFLLLIIAATSLMASSQIATSQLNMKSTDNLRDLGELDIEFTADPNPFDFFTVLTVFTAFEGMGSITVRDKYNNIVNNLYNGTFKRGYNNIVWNGTDNSGQNLPAGYYNCELILGNRYTSRTIILILK
jgi:hypothetical protein